MRTLARGVVYAFAIVGVVASIQLLHGQDASPFDGAVVNHIGIVVKDIDKTTKLFGEAFGVTVPPAKDVGPLPLPAGTPDTARSRVRFTQVKVANSIVEFIQPLSGPGPHQAHLDKYGQGLQHIAFNVKDPKAAILFLQSKGGKLTMSNYVDLQEQLGFTAEISGFPRTAQ